MLQMPLDELTDFIEEMNRIKETSGSKRDNWN
jgi:hypothetical protein